MPLLLDCSDAACFVQGFLHSPFERFENGQLISGSSGTLVNHDIPPRRRWAGLLEELEVFLPVDPPTSWLGSVLLAGGFHAISSSVRKRPSSSPAIASQLQLL